MQLKFTFFFTVISRSFLTENPMVDPWIKWRKSKDRAKKLGNQKNLSRNTNNPWRRTGKSWTGASRFGTTIWEAIVNFFKGIHVVLSDIRNQCKDVTDSHFSSLHNSGAWLVGGFPMRAYCLAAKPRVNNCADANGVDARILVTSRSPPRLFPRLH